MIYTDVLIAGGGPVGLALACELGWRGVRALLVEQNPEFGAEPVAKINLVNVRSMEFCRRWGIANQVRHGGFPDDYPMSVQFLTALRGKRIARLDYPSMGAQGEIAQSPVNRQRIPQHLLDPILRRAAQTFESVDARFATRLEACTDHGTHVEATLADVASGARTPVRARYLAACDGAGSAVRKALGIELIGETLSHSLGIYFRCPRLWQAHPHGKAIMNVLVDRGGMWANLNMIDGFKTWRLSMVGATGPDGRPPAMDAADVAAALRRMLGEGDMPDHEVVGLFPWTRRAVVAETYRHGSCFLVGDAAHQLSPTGGFGMNTGFGDAVDLGWKIAATLAGWGGPGLLDSYDAERRPIGARNVAEATSNFRNLRDLPTFDWIDADGAEADARRAALGERFAAETRKEWESLGVQLGYRYGASPIVAEEPGAPPTDDPIRYAPSSWPGARAPHAWLAAGQSTLDLFGHGFRLLDFGAAAGSAATVQRAAADAGVPLRVSAIGDRGIAALYERNLVMVRPDGHVAWRGDAAPPDPAALLNRLRGGPTA
ncbi:MAG: FAD-dependent monooxygenase [Burkholderiales bacterium]|nr:FAD-dependent monooxygenase [Burkholderiales bacterium]